MALYKNGKMWCWNVICRKNKSSMIPYSIGGQVLFICDNCGMIQAEPGKVERLKTKLEEDIKASREIERARRKRRENRENE